MELNRLSRVSGLGYAGGASHSLRARATQKCLPDIRIYSEGDVSQTTSQTSSHAPASANAQPSIASSILPHLPYLRRFARSLAGRQDSGDHYVAALLEALVADPASFPRDANPRTTLYKSFLRIWNSIEANSHSDAMTAAVDVRLDHITPLPRQAFLLVTMENFSEAEAADALGVDRPKVRALLEEAGREIAGEVATNVLIIEDEPLISMDLENIVTSIGHNVQAIARTHKEAVKAIARQRPGLVLADIHLADGSSGLEAVNEILASVEVPVIFITAYPERLLTGLRPEPTFLIPKPFQPDSVKAIVSQALFFELKAKAKRALAS